MHDAYMHEGAGPASLSLALLSCQMTVLLHDDMVVDGALLSRCFHPPASLEPLWGG
jgi:hypothetical protein